MIYFPSLMLPMQAGEGFKADEKVVEDSGIGVHGSKKESNFDIMRFNLVQSHLYFFYFLLTDSTDRAG